MGRIIDKVLNISLSNDKQVENISKLLSNKVRRDILRLLKDGPRSINNIAFELNAPLSTISEHITMLVKSGLCSIAKVSRDRGQSKIVTRQYEAINLNIVAPSTVIQSKINYQQQIPIGSYTSFNVHKYGGLLSLEGQIGPRDDPNNFYHPNRIKAQLIWFDSGYLEYIIPIDTTKATQITELSFSLEICSEAPNYCEDWKSDIFFEINDVEVGVYTSPGDYGSRHGILTPNWWDATQYGILKNLTITDEGSFLDRTKISNITLNDLKIKDSKLIKFKLGVRDNAKNKGGLNLFGSKFGDYPQDIIMTLTFVPKE